MVNLNNVSVPFGIKLTNVRKVALKYPMKYGTKFIYEFDVYINEEKILKGVIKKANSIDQVRDMVMEDFIQGIKKIY